MGWNFDFDFDLIESAHWTNLTLSFLYLTARMRFISKLE